MPSPAQGSTLKRIALLAAIVSTGATASLGVLVLRWKRDIARELQAIEASGAPLTAADIETPAVTASPWWEGMQHADPVWHLRIMDPVALAALLERPDEELAPFPRDLLEDLEVGLRALEPLPKLVWARPSRRAQTTLPYDGPPRFW